MRESARAKKAQREKHTWHNRREVGRHNAAEGHAANQRHAMLHGRRQRIRRRQVPSQPRDHQVRVENVLQLLRALIEVARTRIAR